MQAWPRPLATSPSHSSLQLQSTRSRSKVYRRTSLKALVAPGPQAHGHSKIVRMSERGKAVWGRVPVSEVSSPENVACDPLASPCRYSTPCKLAKEKEEPEEPCEQKRSKTKSCTGFLPMLSLIPQTLISFQYPSPKMKFSWWRNKIS